MGMPFTFNNYAGTIYISIGVGMIIALLLIVVIVLMVIGFIVHQKQRRKNSLGIPNNATYPNHIYYNNQGKLT